MQENLQIEPEVVEEATQRQRFLCPLCNKHTVLWVLPSTMIKDLPIKCKRCGKESVVNILPETES